jgi:hypothetical protein
MNNYKLQRPLLNRIRESLISEQEVDLPNGEYDGLWSGYTLNIQRQNDSSVEIKTTDGVRGMNCHTNLLIRDKKVYEVW